MNNIELDRDLLPLLPPWYRDVLDYQEICKAEGKELDALAEEIHSVADNFFFQTMDAGAVRQWESIFRIIPSPSETLDFRRARLINRASTRPPFTLGFLYQKLDEIIGPGQWNVRVDYPNYTLYIESFAQDQSYATELAITIGKIKPAHIVYVNSPFVESSVQLAEEISTASREWNYIMSSWALGELPFATDTEKGVIKMASIPSVQPALLEDVADFVADDVSAARLNGVFVVPAISKSVSGSTLTVTYTVNESDVQEIKKIELVDAQGVALTSSSVYVPVVGSILMKHSIPVKEGT